MGNKELKMKLGQLHEEISKPSLPVSADLSNDFRSILLETDQGKLSPFMRLFWEDSKNVYNLLEIMLHYHPMNPATDVTHKTVNIVSSDKCFMCFISDVPHYV